jgi:glycosyltransferase involved in cell wall biosynthesis
MPGWGSWEWIGADLAAALGKSDPVSTFPAWTHPNADVVLVVKHPPPPDWVERITKKAVLIYMPVDFFGDAAQITQNAGWLKLCQRIVIHCERLRRYFEPYARVEYLDHHVKYAATMRRTSRPNGKILWVGVRSNLEPLIQWVNAHPLPAPLQVLTNLEDPKEVPDPTSLGFRSGLVVSIHNWTPETQRQLTAAARAAIDIKGQDFRSQHKPPAKAIDLLASGVPLAMNHDSSPVEHLASLGFRVAQPSDTERWLSREYAQETRRFGSRLRAELSVEKVAERLRQIIADAVAHRFGAAVPARADSLMENSGSEVAMKQSNSKRFSSKKTADLKKRRVGNSQSQTRSQSTPAAKTPVRLYGLLITKDDHAVFADWCRDQLDLYDAVACLDGSESDATARLARQFSDKLHYLHERDFTIRHKTDHGLRRVAHQEIVCRFGAGHWIMCCHTDEYCYHDPRQIAQKAEQEGFDQVSWFSPHFYPHPDELSDWPQRRLLPLSERFHHYHWNYLGNGFPWLEDRLYRALPGVEWDEETHGNVRPHGLKKPAPFHPTFRHFKVAIADPAWYEREDRCAHYRHHWQGLENRTGLPYRVRTLEDLFVRSVPDYVCCDRFEGGFDHPWNLGEQYRVKGNSNPGTPQERQRRRAVDLAVAGLPADARLLLQEIIDRNGIPKQLQTLVRNDLAVLRAVLGETETARSEFAALLQSDSGCESARENLRFLEQIPRRVAAVPNSSATSTPPIKVAVLSLLFNWPSTGGGNVHTAELTQFLAKAGYEVRHYHARFAPWGIGTIQTPPPFPSEGIAFNESEWDARAVQRRFRAAVDQFNPDYVILTDSWNFKPLLAEAMQGYPYLLRLQALECLCPLNNVRLLTEPDGRVRQCPLHQLASPEACASCVRDRGHLSGPLHQAERGLSGVGTPEYAEKLRRAFGEAEAVLVVNPLIEAMVSPYARQVRVVTAGMDPARFPWPPPVVPRPDDRKRILFAGLLDEWMKGYHILREACGRLWEKRRDFELVVTGDAPTVSDPFTRYVGWQSQEELPKLLWSCDVLAMPTVAQEALGRTAVEAMAAGKAVVASRLGGLPFTVAEGATGLLCEPGDAADLAAKLEILLDDAALRDRLGQAGRKRFEEDYSWPVIIERHYRPLLARRAVAECRGGAIECGRDR